MRRRPGWRRDAQQCGFDLRLDIRHAKVQTLGDEVVDSFYVVDQRGAKLEDESRIAELRRAVLFELSRVNV